jgi:hypothetical protein
MWGRLDEVQSLLWCLILSVCWIMRVEKRGMEKRMDYKICINLSVILKLSKFPFQIVKIPCSKLSKFPFQTVKIFLSKLSKFPFPNCQNFPFLTVKISLFKLSKFLFSKLSKNFLSKLFEKHCIIWQSGLAMPRKLFINSYLDTTKSSPSHAVLDLSYMLKLPHSPFLHINHSDLKLWLSLLQWKKNQRN